MKYPVVYSYRKSLTRELELSIESLKNLQEWNGQIYIIGEKPDLEADYTYLPVKYTWGKESRVRSNDEICAYLTAADFLDEFIIMADDITILKPWSLEYENRGTLDDHIKQRKRFDTYTRQLELTKRYLSRNGSPTLSYELHIPFLMKAEQLRPAAEIARTNSPVFIRSLIGNMYEIPSTLSGDTKNIPITDQTVIYSSQDRTFSYEKVKEHLK
jgi:hypothetical protein